MDIWTEKLEPCHLSDLKRWIGRSSGMFTANDLPATKVELPIWLEERSDTDHLDCLILAYETPVGLGGFRQSEKPRAGEMYLFLGEVGYNPIRVATYATQRILDQAFADYPFDEMIIKVYSSHIDYVEILVKMGFHKMAEDDELIILSIEKGQFMSNKYLF